MTLGNFIELYGGWAGLIIYFIYKEIWPLLTKKIIPSRLKEIEDDRHFYQLVEKERLEETKKIAEAVQTLALSMVQTNTNIQAILTNQSLIISRQDSIYNVLNEGIADMRAVTGTRSKKGD